MSLRLAGRKSLILRLSGREDGSVLKLFRRALWTLSWEATSVEMRQFMEEAPVDSWENLLEYVKQWMVVE